MPGFYDNSWDQVVSHETTESIQDRTGYSEHEIIQEHLSIFMEYMEGEDRGTQHQAWVDYLEFMVEPGHTREEREEFLEDVFGIEYEDFDWAAWREAMGY